MRRHLAGVLAAPLLVGTALAAAPAEGEAEGGLPQLNTETYASQVFWLLIAFLVLYLLMSRIFLPRLGGMIEERRQRVADDFDKAAEFKRQAEEAEAEYKRALSDAKARASKIAQETRDEIDAEIRAMQADTDQKLEAEIAAAEARIEETSAQAASAVREAARETTRAVVMALIDEQPSDDAVDAALKSAEGARS
ncbi:F0F1 ATP synthase subunit B' [Parvularcula sp. ZS-1/3]|uniref:ATP synthase subunit b n=1 Tax=Parvularcula mediterranea TaxID=2732508 RepID=A0A7Y3RNY2_9PROT|nr:F0F1 ATP synthase subunit B' [Parvularcula mediterranea]NNU17594.1 F0F1 ATP synthase subunit B' [Parvularcula mediterranea]